MDGSNIDADAAHRATSSELRQFIERIESLRAEIADIKAAEKEVFAEAKARGYMTRPIRSIIKERAEDPDARAEHDAVVEMYRSALGMS